jgi:hypothetical protein
VNVKEHAAKAPPGDAAETRPILSQEQFSEAVTEIKASEFMLRVAARELMAGVPITQSQLAAIMGISQPSVSHMLGTRTYGLTVAEVMWIELACGAKPGTLCMMAGLFYDPASAFLPDRPEPPSLEQQVYDIPGITTQAAEAIVAAITAVRAEVLRNQKRRPS